MLHHKQVWGHVSTHKAEGECKTALPLSIRNLFWLLHSHSNDINLFLKAESPEVITTESLHLSKLSHWQLSFNMWAGEMAQTVKGTYPLIWQSGFHSQSPHHGRRESTPTSCPLISIYELWCTHAHTHTHRHIGTHVRVHSEARSSSGNACVCKRIFDNVGAMILYDIC